MERQDAHKTIRPEWVYRQAAFFRRLLQTGCLASDCFTAGTAAQSLRMFFRKTDAIIGQETADLVLAVAEWARSGGSATAERDRSAGIPVIYRKLVAVHINDANRPLDDVRAIGTNCNHDVCHLFFPSSLLRLR